MEGMFNSQRSSSAPVVLGVIHKMCFLLFLTCQILLTSVSLGFQIIIPVSHAIGMMWKNALQKTPQRRRERNLLPLTIAELPNCR
ncbi:MAG: putative transmembrane protein [Macrobrachium rosenbergii virus 2]|nr:MAG: putative transmembrane protein [Macrobrachium rosenbergii virus 2]